MLVKGFAEEYGQYASAPSPYVAELPFRIGPHRRLCSTLPDEQLIVAPSQRAEPQHPTSGAVCLQGRVVRVAGYA